MNKIEYNTRIEEKIQEIAENELSYEQVENIVWYIIWLTEGQIKNEIINRIGGAKYFNKPIGLK